jgi:class 3 adenylate cyclase
MKTQNLAVRFTDIQGFTSMTNQQTREENAAFLRLHDALLQPARPSATSRNGGG